MKAALRALLLLIAFVAVAGGLVAYSIAARGLSTRVAPTRAEEVVARAMRRFATPRVDRTRPNPVIPSAEVLRDARAHFADHCASCHANDGSGETPLGKNLYPRAPDMRATRTQALSDGEMFAIIEHGIRLTGMPGWSTGTPDGERASWSLVHFIRQLPKLTPDEIAEMEALNPRSPEECRAEEEARRFLAGEDGAPTAPRPAKSGDHRH